MRLSRFVAFAFSLIAIVTFGCARPIPKPRMVEKDVIRAAKAELMARFPDSVAAYEPYHAEFRDGVWSVSGTAPAETRGGGAPEAAVRDADGKVTEVHLSR